MKRTKIISIITLFLILLSACSTQKNHETKAEKIIIDETKRELQTINEESIYEIETEKETSNETETETESESESESEKETMNEEIKLGNKITIKNDFNIYGTASDAKNRIRPTRLYKSGDYYIYKIVKHAINLTRDPKLPGGWANYEDVNIDINSIENNDFNENKNSKNNANNSNQNTTDNNVASSKSDILNAIKNSNLSTQANEWSYAYPSHLDLLQKYNGYNKISASAKTLYLTFDNGYEYKNNTSKILDILNKNGVKATFFTTGAFIKENPDVAKRILNEGHNLANHSERHINQAKSSPSDVYDDITTWESTAKSVIKSNRFAKLMRPPEGAFSETSLFIANKLGYKTILWNFAYGDWDTNNQPNPQSSLKKLLEHNENGSIVLLHAVSDTNVEILEQYIKESEKQGYSFKLL